MHFHIDDLDRKTLFTVFVAAVIWASGEKLVDLSYHRFKSILTGSTEAPVEVHAAMKAPVRVSREDFESPRNKEFFDSIFAELRGRQSGEQQRVLMHALLDQAFLRAQDKDILESLIERRAA